MDFFASQHAARQHTKRLIAFFIAAVGLIILAIYLLIIASFDLLQTSGKDGRFEPSTWWHGELFFYVAGCTLLLITSGSLYRIATLRQGGRRVAEMLGGLPISPNTRDFQEKCLLNVVEEMSLAAGITVPPVYIMHKEMGINAFAAGFKPEDAVIGVTRGTIENLSRDELQGVIAHEFSHILNGDMMLNIKLIGVLHGILLISLVGRTVLRGANLRGDNDRKAGLALVLFAFTLILIGSIGVFFGRLIKSAVSRQREFLADASAVQFTRNPDGLSGALKKIGGLSAGSKIQHPKAEAISHLFFGNGLRPSSVDLFATHPPLKNRILRLDPHFDGAYPEIKKSTKETQTATPPKTQKTEQPSAIPIPIPLPIPIPDVMKAPILAALAASPPDLIDAIGAPGAGHLQAARQLMESIPDSLLKGLHEPTTARALMQALIISQHADVAKRQWSLLTEQLDNPHYKMTQETHEHLKGLPRNLWLPLAELCLPALREQSEQQYEAFRSTIHELIQADEIVSLFEYALRQIVVRSLDAHFGKNIAAPTASFTLEKLVPECVTAISILARWGHDSDIAASEAFQTAMQIFPNQPPSPSLLDASDCTLTNMDQALSKLRNLIPQDKKQIILACFKSLAHDSEIRLVEAELFRAIGAALDCPVPLWLGVEDAK